MAIEGGLFQREYDQAPQRFVYDMKKTARPYDCVLKKEDIEATNQLDNYSAFGRVVIIIICSYLISTLIIIIELMFRKLTNKSILKQAWVRGCPRYDRTPPAGLGIRGIRYPPKNIRHPWQ